MSNTGQETPDQARTRRRWISLAEVVAVAGVLIAGVSLYLSWSDKREERAEAAAVKQAEGRAASVVTLRASREKGGQRLTLADPAHPVDAIDVTFPSDLGVQSQEAVLKPAIDADWVKGEMLTLTDGGKDEANGRLPVLIASTFWDGDTKRTDRAIYDVIWRTKGQMLAGRDFKLEGVVLRERGGDQKRLDAIWKTVAPRKD